MRPAAGYWRAGHLRVYSQKFLCEESEFEEFKIKYVKHFT